jgi:hypothetical protein
MRFYPENAYGIYPAVVQVNSTSTIVIGVPGKSIRVINAFLTASANVNIKWQSHNLPTDLTGFAYVAQTGGYVLPSDYFGWFQTLVSESLDLNVSGAANIGGVINYNLIGP